MMQSNEIEDYLSSFNISLEQSVYDQIQNVLDNAISDNNEEVSNYYWCLKTIFMIQKTFLKAFNDMKAERYEEAWRNLDSADIMLSGLTQNFDIKVGNDKYHLVFISRILREYQKTFPYHHFFSRECVIKSEKCSICGKRVLLRKPCGHKLGKLYMGKQCQHVITDLEMKAIAIVTKPFDKYTYVNIPNKEYDYGMVKMLISEINSPYESFWIETVKKKKPEYEKIGRNSICPCGSGLKYKRCHLGNMDELMDHNIVHLTHPAKKKYPDIQYFGTWKT